jgi:Putative peptidoglycan-binding domain-containing protein
MWKFKSVTFSLVITLSFSLSTCFLGVSAANVQSIKNVSKSAIEDVSVNNRNSTIVKSVASNTVVTPQFNYDPMSGPSIENIVYDEGGVVQEGDVGYAVYELQGYLNQLSTMDGYHTINQDGYFGTDTFGAVAAFQDHENHIGGNWYLSVDGIVGHQTLSHIRGEIFA